VVFVNGYIHRRLNSRPLDWLIARIFRQVDLCLCVSRASAEALVAEFGVEPERAVAYGLWIEPESIDAIVPPDSYRNRPYENPARLLYVGRLEPDKGLDVLTRAVTLAVERGDAGRCHFTFIGDGAPQVERELADLASRCTNCDYLGRIAKPELWRHYAQADLVVIPSKWEEAGGNVALEAGAFGLPVVAARRGGLPEIVEAYPHHRLVGPHEADAYLAAIDGLWGEVRKVGRRAVWDETRRSLENFSFERKFGIFYEAVTRLMTERR
jgi:glycosyltransferase involved in cell wall biosynthesis